MPFFAKQQIANGEAFAKLKEMVQAQGGDTSVLTTRRDSIGRMYVMRSWRKGKGSSMQWIRSGAELLPWSWRWTREKGGPHRLQRGIVLRKKVGDFVRKGEVLASFYSSEESKCRTAEQTFTQPSAFRMQGRSKPR